MNDKPLTCPTAPQDLHYLRPPREQAPRTETPGLRPTVPPIQRPGREMEVLVHRIITYLENEA